MKEIKTCINSINRVAKNTNGKIVFIKKTYKSNITNDITKTYVVGELLGSGAILEKEFETFEKALEYSNNLLLKHGYPPSEEIETEIFGE